MPSTNTPDQFNLRNDRGADSITSGRTPAIDSDDDGEAMVTGVCERLDVLEAEQEQMSRFFQDQFRTQREKLASLRRFVMNESIRNAGKKKRRYEVKQYQQYSATPPVVGSGGDTPVVAESRAKPAPPPIQAVDDDDIVMSDLVVPPQKGKGKATLTPRQEKQTKKAPSPAPVSIWSPSPDAPVAPMAGIPAEPPPRPVQKIKYSGPPRGDKKKRGVSSARTSTGRQSVGGKGPDDAESDKAEDEEPEPKRNPVVKARRAGARPSGLTRETFTTQKRVRVASSGSDKAEPSKIRRMSSSFTPVNKSAIAGPSEAEADNLPNNPKHFSGDVVKAVFGTGKLNGSIVKLSDRAMENQRVECTFYATISPEQHSDPPLRMLAEGAMLDIDGIEILLEMDRDIAFPLLLKQGKDKFLYCGNYAFGETRTISVQEWKDLSFDLKKHWAKKATPIGGGNERLRNLLVSLGHLKPSETRNIDTKLIMDYFNLTDPKKGLRLSSTELLPVDFDAHAYEQLFKQARLHDDGSASEDDGDDNRIISVSPQPVGLQHRTAKNTPWGLPSSASRPAYKSAPAVTPSTVSSDRSRIEEQPADFDDGEDPFALKPTPTKPTKTPKPTKPLQGDGGSGSAGGEGRTRRAAASKATTYDVVALSKEGFESSPQEEEESDDSSDIIPAHADDKVEKKKRKGRKRMPSINLISDEEDSGYRNVDDDDD